MTIFELIISKNAFVFILFNWTVGSKNDPFMDDKKYGITMSTQWGLSWFPVVGIFYGNISQECWINHVGFVEEETVLRYDNETVYVDRTFIVDGFNYKMRSGTVHTVKAGTNKIIEKPVPCWILIDEQKGKTPLGSLNYICFTNRKGQPQDTEKIIRSLLNIQKAIQETRSNMKTAS